MRTVWVRQVKARVWLVAILAVALSAPAAANASLEVDREETNVDGPTVIVARLFDHSITISDALRANEELGLNAVAVRFANPTAVGEYSLNDGLGLVEFERWFRELYGTEAQAVGLLVPVPAVEADLPEYPQSLTAKANIPLLVPVEKPTNIPTNASEFVAPEPVDGVAADYFERSSPDLAPAGGPATGGIVQTVVPPRLSWAPDYMEIRVERISNRQYFYQFAHWKNGADADNTPTATYCPGASPCRTVNWGIEFGVDVYNNDQPNADRPFCSPDESAFLATNESYTWGASMGAVNLVTSQTMAYADTWEIADSCRKNAFAIGFGTPGGLPNNANGFEQVLISINAPIGTKATGLLGGSVTLNDDLACQLSVSLPLAACMGDFLLAPPSSVQPFRLTLNPDRDWVAASSKCWISASSGRVNPAFTIPYDSDGCF